MSKKSTIPFNTLCIVGGFIVSLGIVIVGTKVVSKALCKITEKNFVAMKAHGKYETTRSYSKRDFIHFYESHKKDTDCTGWTSDLFATLMKADWKLYTDIPDKYKTTILAECTIDNSDTASLVMLAEICDSFKMENFVQYAYKYYPSKSKKYWKQVDEIVSEKYPDSWCMGTCKYICKDMN